MEPMHMPYKLLRKVTDNFSEERILGSGSFGVVYKGVQANGEDIAVKVLMNMTGLDDTKFKNEFQNLARLKHQNIVRLVGYCNESVKQVAEYDGRKVIAEKIHTALCLEYVKNGSLDKHISDQNQGLPWHIRYRIIKGICEGLKYLREGLDSPVWHLDLKPQNILLDKEMTPKIADFGLSRLIGDERTRKTMNSVGTCGYWPPEYIRLQLITKAFDIFSLGVIIAKIMIGTEGYHSSADMPPQKLVRHVHNNWRKKLQDILRPRSLEVYCKQVKACIEIASKCLKEDRHERPTIQEIVLNLNQTEIMIHNLPLKNELQFGLLLWWRRRRRGKKGLDDDVIAQQSAKPPCRVEHFTLDALQVATGGFCDDRRIRSGRFGSVYRGTLPSGCVVAIKRAESVPELSSSEAQSMRLRDREIAFNSELTALERANHKNIVCLLGCCTNSGERVLVYEFMANGTLHDQLHSRSPLAPAVASWRGRLTIALYAARGIEYMHVYAVPPIIHRDVKSANILLDDSWTAKIADFGLSSVLDAGVCCGGGNGSPQEPLYTGGTVGYMDPEYYRLQLLTDKSDVYSFGVVLLELMSGCRVVQRYAESVTPKNVVEFAVPLILADDVARVLDPRLPAPTPDEAEALAYVGYLAADCVGPVGCDRPSMTEVVDALERALAACGAGPLSCGGTASRALSRSGTDQFDLTDTN